jgi:hypothetical protein
MPQIEVKTPELWQFTFFVFKKRPEEALLNT